MEVWPTPSRDFAGDPDLPVLVDALARRYAVTPADVLRWGPVDVSIALAAYYAAKRAEQRAQRAAGRAGGAFPVISIGGL